MVLLVLALAVSASTWSISDEVSVGSTVWVLVDADLTTVTEGGGAAEILSTSEEVGIVDAEDCVVVVAVEVTLLEAALLEVLDADPVELEELEELVSEA